MDMNMFKQIMTGDELQSIQRFCRFLINDEEASAMRRNRIHKIQLGVHYLCPAVLL